MRSMLAASLVAVMLGTSRASSNSRNLAIKPFEINCFPISTDCSSCGSDYLQCGGDGCYKPCAGEICCPDGTICPGGTYCVGGGFCCPENALLGSCQTDGYNTTNATTSSITTIANPISTTVASTTNKTQTSNLFNYSTTSSETVSTYMYHTPTYPWLSTPNVGASSTLFNVSSTGPPIIKVTGTASGAKMSAAWHKVGLIFMAGLYLLSMG